MALTYDDLDAAVRRTYLPTLIDQFFVSNALLVRLMSKSRVVLDSGKDIGQPVLYGKLAGGSYSGMDTFDIVRRNTKTLAVWDWRGNYANITISGWDMAITEGDEKIIGLLESEMETASMTLNDNTSEQIMGDGTGNDSKDFNGLLDGIATGNIYGGINRAEEPWWRAKVDTTGGAVTIDAINSMIGQCTVEQKKPDLIITSQAVYDKVWARCQPQQRFLSGNGKHSDLASVGFSGIEFNGHAAILVDPHCPAGYMFFLNTDSWKFILNKNKNFQWTEPKTPINADAYVRQLLVIGNLFTVAPRLNGLLTGLS